jgi:hypothetical protein
LLHAAKNSKSEKDSNPGNSKLCRMSKAANEAATEVANLGGLVLGLAHWNFEFVSDFPLALAFGFWPAPGCALCVTKV